MCLSLSPRCGRTLDGPCTLFLSNDNQFECSAVIVHPSLPKVASVLLPEYKIDPFKRDVSLKAVRMTRYWLPSDWGTRLSRLLTMKDKMRTSPNESVTHRPDSDLRLAWRRHCQTEI